MYRIEYNQLTDYNWIYTKEDDVTYKYYILHDFAKRLENVFIRSAERAKSGGHINVYDKDSMFMITTINTSSNEKTNKQRVNKLLETLWENKLGYIRVLTNFEKRRNKEFNAESIIVFQPEGFDSEKFKKIALSLASKFSSTAVMINIPEIMPYGFYNKSGKLIRSLGKEIDYSEQAIEKMIADFFKYNIKSSPEMNVKWIAVKMPNNFVQTVAAQKRKENIFWIK